MTAEVRTDPSDPGRFVTEIGTTSGAYTGAVEVLGEINDVAVATAEPDPAGWICRIELRMTAPDRLRVSEIDNCLAHHGTACGLSGELVRLNMAETATPDAAPADAPAARQAEQQRDAAARPPAPAGGRGGSVPWAPGCEFLQISSDYAPVEVTETVPADATDCYAFAPIAGTDVAIALAGRNVQFSIEGVVDGVERYDFRASGYGYRMVVGQLMPSRGDEPYRLIFLSAWPHSPDASSPPAAVPALGAADVAAVQSLLAELGYDPGPVDGILGAQTEAAIRTFLDERSFSRPPTIDAELIRLLDAAR